MKPCALGLQRAAATAEALSASAAAAVRREEKWASGAERITEIIRSAVEEEEARNADQP